MTKKIPFTSDPSVLKSTLSATLLTALILSGCGSEADQISNSSSKGNLLALIAKGRHVAAPIAVDGTGLQLNGDGSIVEAKMDAVTGAPKHLLYDTSVTQAHYAFPELTDTAESIAVTLLRPFVSGSWRLMRRSDLARDLGEGLASVSFSIEVGDLAVRDSTVDMYFTKMSDGMYALREVFTRHATVGLASSTDLPPATRLDVNSFARLGLADEDYQIISERQVIYPREISLNVYSYEVASEVTLRDVATNATIVATIGSREGGDILEAYSDRFEATGVQGSIYPRSYLDPKAVEAMSFAKLVAGPTTAPLDADGATAQALTGAASLQLGSSRVQIGPAPGYSITTQIVDGKAAIAPTANDLNAANAYMAVQKINSFTRRHLQEAQAPVLTRPVLISLNVAGSCNAFYTNTSISLFSAGNGCANMALVNDVIHHEWGHGLDDYTGTATGITDGAFSEGIGDILAGYGAGDSHMGVGFFTTTPSGVRELKNTSVYPTNRGEVHAEGQIIGGAFWDLRVALIERYGTTKGAYMAERLFFQHLLTTDSYLDSYDALLRLDDNDGNPATPSPNRCLINATFASHGLATVIAGCTDKPSGFGYKANSDLAAAIFERTDAGVRIMAAAGLDARSMKACFGDAAACSDLAAAGWQSLTLDGKLGDRVAFTAKSPVAMPAGTLIWLAAFDGKDQLMGRRALKLVSR